jgi:hypothetical protein
MLLRDRMSALKRPRDLPSGTPSRAERRTLRCDRQMDSSPTPPFPKSEKSPRNSVPSTMTCWTFCLPTRSRTVRMPLGSTLSKSMRSSIRDNAECGTKPRGEKRSSRDAGKKRATTLLHGYVVWRRCTSRSANANRSANAKCGGRWFASTIASSEFNGSSLIPTTTNAL